MPRILVTEGFKFAVDGLHVIEVAPGEQDVSERCAVVAVEHLKVASRLDAAAPVVKVASSLVVPVVPVEPAKAPLVAAVVPPVAQTPPAPVKPATPPKPMAKPKAAAKPAAKPKANAGGQ